MPKIALGPGRAYNFFYTRGFYTTLPHPYSSVSTYPVSHLFFIMIPKIPMEEPLMLL